MELSGKKTILLVEDEEFVALPQQKQLEAEGFEVHHVTSGEDALALARGNNVPDLILMDITLGEGLDGVQTAREILAYRKVPIVFLTAHADKDTVDMVRDVCCYGYVVKSAGRFVLLQTIHRALELFASMMEKERQEELLRVVSENLNSSRKSLVELKPEIRHRIIDQVSEAIITTDLSLRITSWNQAATAIYGWTPEEALGHPVDWLLHTEFLEVTQEDAQSELAEKARWKGVVRQRTKGGRTVFLEAAVTWIKDPAETIIGGVTVNRDITEEYLLRHAMEIRTEMFLHISSANTVADALTVLLEYCCSLESIDCGGVYLREDDGETYRLVAQHGVDAEIIEKMTVLPADNRVFQKITTLKAPWYTEFSEFAPTVLHPRYRDQIRAVVVLPLISEDTLLGSISLGSAGYDRFPDTVRYVLESFITWTGEIIEKKRTEDRLKEAKARLQKKTADLEEANIALKVLLHHIQEEQEKQSRDLYQQVSTLVTPFVERLRGMVEDEQTEKLVEAIQLNLNTVLGGASLQEERYFSVLSPKEQQVAALVKEGRTNKEIAKIIGTSSHTVAFHRKNIREKLDIRGEKKNLAAYLRSMYGR